MSDAETEDQELTAMAEKIEQDLAESVQKKKQVRSVSGTAVKTVRSLFLEQSTLSAGDLFMPTATSSTSSEQLMTLTPVKKGQPSSASQDFPVLTSESHSNPCLSLATSDFLIEVHWYSVPLLDLPPVDHCWVSSALYFKDHLGNSSFDFSRISGLWLRPPQAPLIPQSTPKLHHFFGHRVFLWMPVKLWSLKIACPHPECSNPELSFAGVYPVVRQVLDMFSFYNLVSETLWCKKCKRKMVSWSYNILSQIDIGHRSYFPCLLTRMKACDLTVVRWMRWLGFGNSASQVQKRFQQQHSTQWHEKTFLYLSACEHLTSADSSGLIEHQTFPEPPAMTPVPQYRWLMQVYIQDVLQRLDEVKANITSVFGRVLQVFSTKEITKKLTGQRAGTAEWATNVGNEYGQVLMSVIRSGEDRFGLHRMAKGLMKRFSDANQPPPEILYVDRDCCGQSSICHLFDDWQDAEVRLDVWHFMQRLYAGSLADLHPLYDQFMQKLSCCIFAWDNDDLRSLKAAKRSELLARHVGSPSEDEIMRSITKSELVLHCRRETRGVDETMLLIEELIKSFDGDTGKDTLGEPLINSHRMQEEWEVQQQHIACIQDPQGVQLYIQTGSLKKGGQKLPTYRCLRGSIPLESFHLHLNRFIPGTLTNDIVFQAYLVDCLSRWNQDRASVATGTKEPQSYNVLLEISANQLAEEVFGRKITSIIPPRKYTGELIGIEYLYDQTGRPLQEYDAAIQQMEDTGLDVPEEDESFVEREAVDFTIFDLPLEKEDSLDDRELSVPHVETSPATRTYKEPSKLRAHVTEQPSMMSPATRTYMKPSKSKACVTELPSMASQGEQLNPLPKLCPVANKQILPYLTDAEQEEMHAAQEYDDLHGRAEPVFYETATTATQPVFYATTMTAAIPTTTQPVTYATTTATTTQLVTYATTIATHTTIQPVFYATATPTTIQPVTYSTTTATPASIQPVFFATTPITVQPVFYAVAMTAATTTKSTEPLVSSVSVPYTTVRYRKRKAQEESMGQRRRTYNKKKSHKTCKKCGQIIEKQSHINYFGNLYCQNSEIKSFEEWKEQYRHRNYGRKKAM